MSLWLWEQTVGRYLSVRWWFRRRAWSRVKARTLAAVARADVAGVPDVDEERRVMNRTEIDWGET